MAVSDAPEQPPQRPRNELDKSLLGGAAAAPLQTRNLKPVQLPRDLLGQIQEDLPPYRFDMVPLRYIVFTALLGIGGFDGVMTYRYATGQFTQQADFVLAGVLIGGLLAILAAYLGRGFKSAMADTSETKLRARPKK